MADAEAPTWLARLAKAVAAPVQPEPAGSPEEEYLQTLGPVDLLRLRTALQNKRVYSPGEAAANRRQTGADLLYATPLGNALSLRDAMESKWRAQQLEAQGDAEGARREYANAAASTGMGFLPGMGRIGLGKTASTIAREADTTLPAILAYHGSPHNFDRFDMSKIGTGEGAQVFGHGLYFAENPTVAKQYQLNLSPLQSLTYKGIDVKGGPRIDDPNYIRGNSYIISAGGNIDRAVQLAEQDFQHPRTPDKEQLAQVIQELKNDWKVKSAGKLYHAELDVEPHQLLDWDKPLSEQTPEIQKMLEDMGVPSHQPTSWGPMNGQAAWEHLNRKHGSPDAASQALRETGIPGIRYLDQGSRDAGEGTHNIVMFDDSLIKMLGKE